MKEEKNNIFDTKDDDMKKCDRKLQRCTETGETSDVDECESSFAKFIHNVSLFSKINEKLTKY